MLYRSVYPCWVIDEIRKGKKVYVLDRKLRKVFTVNDANVETVVRLIESTDKELGRYDFWYEEENEVKENAEL